MRSQIWRPAYPLRLRSANRPPPARSGRGSRAVAASITCSYRQNVLPYLASAASRRCGNGRARGGGGYTILRCPNYIAIISTYAGGYFRARTIDARARLFGSWHRKGCVLAIFFKACRTSMNRAQNPTSVTFAGPDADHVIRDLVDEDPYPVGTPRDRPQEREFQTLRLLCRRRLRSRRR
jgi:hypothetical protein